MPSGGLVPIQGGSHPGNPHIPGVYPPSSLASDLLAREREKQDRLGELILFIYNKKSLYYTGRKYFYLMTHSTHFICGYLALDVR